MEPQEAIVKTGNVSALGPVVAGGPERGANLLASDDPLDRHRDVDGQADAVADRHVQGLDAARRVDRHGRVDAIHISTPHKGLQREARRWQS